MSASSLAAQEVPTKRTTENPITQGEDAFGITVGRETIGIYDGENIRGFSPLEAGNTRIEGLYFDQFLRPITRIRESTTIRVGIAAQGYLFPSPTGVVDYELRRPGTKAALSTLTAGDSLGTRSWEADGQLPIAGQTLSIGMGAFVGSQHFYNGTRNHSDNEGLELRWRPSPTVEILPFWSRSQVHDQTGPLYIPTAPVLPPRIPRNRFQGPSWARYRGVAGAYGMLGRFDLGRARGCVLEFFAPFIRTKQAPQT